MSDAGEKTFVVGSLICVVIGTVLVLLRAIGAIDWPWVWIAVPLCAPAGLVFVSVPITLLFVRKRPRSSPPTYIHPNPKRKS